MDKIEPCDLGYKGECCCGCQFQVPIRKRLDDEVIGYVCVVFYTLGEGLIYLEDDKHGYCEEYRPRTYRAPKEKRK